MQSIKEAASNMAASAKAGMDKTKATVQEKGEKMTTHDPMQKEMATQKKEDKINRAELHKQETHHHNAASKVASGDTHSYSTTGETGQPTGMHQRSALPGHGTGEPMGQVTEGTVSSHPIGRNTGTHNTNFGPGANKGYGTGGAYS